MKIKDSFGGPFFVPFFPFLLKKGKKQREKEKKKKKREESKHHYTERRMKMIDVWIKDIVEAYQESKGN